MTPSLEVQGVSKQVSKQPFIVVFNSPGMCKSFGVLLLLSSFPTRKGERGTPPERGRIFGKFVKFGMLERWNASDRDPRSVGLRTHQCCHAHVLPVPPSKLQLQLPPRHTVIQCAHCWQACVPCLLPALVRISVGSNQRVNERVTRSETIKKCKSR